MNAAPAAVYLLAGLGASFAAHALEILEVRSQREGNDYFMEIEASLAASPDRVLAIVTDYARIHELHPNMVESRSLGMVAPGVEEVYTRLEGCVLVFCRTLHRVERIERVPVGLLAEDVPGRGSFREGRTEWRITPQDPPHGGGTRLRYEIRFVPAFWVPPLVGPGVLARHMQQMTLETLAEVELRAADDGR